jgi:hypothetical protein
MVGLTVLVELPPAPPLPVPPVALPPVKLLSPVRTR